MDRFIARANIGYKLAAEFELLADVAGAIAKCPQRIKKQQVLVEMLESEGRDGVAGGQDFA
jgi:hypothetical protein